MSGHPVEFIVFGLMEACIMICNHVSRREFIKSNSNEEISVDAQNGGMHMMLYSPKID